MKNLPTTVPAYNTYRLTTAKPAVLQELIRDFFHRLAVDREAEVAKYEGKTAPRVKPIDINAYAHALGFPSYQRLKAFAESDECPDEATDILEWGRSIIESEHIEGGLTDRYNASISKLILSSVHNMNEKVENVGAGGGVVVQIAGIQQINAEIKLEDIL
jgi:hypothetical protein